MFPLKIDYKKQYGSRQHLYLLVHMGNKLKGTSLQKFAKGVMTVECALVLPIFIFLVIGIYYLIAMLQMDINIKNAVSSIGKEYAQFAYVTDNKEISESKVGKIGINLLSSVCVKNEIIDLVGKNYLDNSVVVGGSEGIKCVCENVTDNSMVNIILNYSYGIPVNYFGVSSLNMSSITKVRKWTGYDMNDKKDEDQLVYITETGSVYHTNINCSHLKLSIRSVAYDDIVNIRNSGQAKYHKCELCCKGKINNIVYITDDGNRFHNTLQCSGLKRNILTVPISEVGDRSLCKRCQGNGG